MNQNIATLCEGTSFSLDVAILPTYPVGQGSGQIA